LEGVAGDMGAGADAGECSGNVAFARNGDAGCMAGNLVAAHVEAQCRTNLTDDEPIAVMFDLVNPNGRLAAGAVAGHQAFGRARS
jgi:hypothetical protein